MRLLYLTQTAETLIFSPIADVSSSISFQERCSASMSSHWPFVSRAKPPDTGRDCLMHLALFQWFCTDRNGLILTGYIKRLLDSTVYPRLSCRLLGLSCERYEGSRANCTIWVIHSASDARGNPRRQDLRVPSDGVIIGLPEI